MPDRYRKKEMKIEFGGGKNIRPGFVPCDVRPLGHIEYVCNCWEIDQHVPESSVEEIYSRHMFEHLTFQQGRMALMSWHRILKVDGKVNLVMPDFKYHAEEYIKYYNNRDLNPKTMPGFQHAIASIFGWQREGEDTGFFTSDKKLWDVHKSGYDEISLKQLVESYGYKNFERQENPKGKWHLDVTFFKE